MKLIRTEDAAGQMLCHDITQIIPGEFKGARFRKGHVIQPEDIPVLLSIGKENLYVWEKKPGILHEDEAAALLYKAAAGKNIHGTEPKEGKIELIADCDGLLKIDRDALLAVNRTPQMMIATIHGDLPVKKGQKLAGTRIIPLVIEQEKMDAMQAAAGSTPILNVLPMQPKKFAVITTGSEVFKGRILLVDLPGVFFPDEDMVLADILELFHVLLGDHLASMKGRALKMIVNGCNIMTESHPHCVFHFHFFHSVPPFIPSIQNPCNTVPLGSGPLPGGTSANTLQPTMVWRMPLPCSPVMCIPTTPPLSSSFPRSSRGFGLFFGKSSKSVTGICSSAQFLLPQSFRIAGSTAA